MGNHSRQRVMQNVRVQTQHFIRDRTHFHHHILFDHLLDQIRVLVQGEPMADSTCVEEYSIEQVEIC